MVPGLERMHHCHGGGLTAGKSKPVCNWHHSASRNTPSTRQGSQQASTGVDNKESINITSRTTQKSFLGNKHTHSRAHAQVHQGVLSTHACSRTRMPTPKAPRHSQRTLPTLQRREAGLETITVGVAQATVHVVLLDQAGHGKSYANMARCQTQPGQNSKQRPRSTRNVPKHRQLRSWERVHQVAAYAE